jgi:hypothetical protein
MDQDIAVGMGEHPLIVRDLDPAEHQPAIRRETMGIEALTNQHR